MKQPIKKTDAQKAAEIPAHLIASAQASRKLNRIMAKAKRGFDLAYTYHIDGAPYSAAQVILRTCLEAAAEAEKVKP